MNAFWAVFLGIGSSAGLGGLVYTIFKDVRDRHLNERIQEAGVAVDEVTEKRIIAEAAQISSDTAIAQQNWWRESFDFARGELAEAQKRIRQLEAWAREHQTWDQRAWHLAVQSDPEYPPPPTLEDL